LRSPELDGIARKEKLGKVAHNMQRKKREWSLVAMCGRDRLDVLKTIEKNRDFRRRSGNARRMTCKKATDGKEFGNRPS